MEVAIDIKKQNKEALHWILNYSLLRETYIHSMYGFNEIAATVYTGMPHGSGTGNPTVNKAITLSELEHQKKWLMTIECMESTLSEKRKAFLEFRRRAEQLDNGCEVGRPGCLDYVQVKYAEWHQKRYGYGFPPSKQTMCRWMKDIIDVTVRIAIRQGVL
jgi:hypothetical protein